MTRILIVKFWALGDILMATPLLRALKRRWPECEITWLVDQEYAQALRGNPLLDEVLPLDTGTWRKTFRYGNLIAYGAMTTRLRRDLAERRFDIVINLTAEKWWSLWLNPAPIRIGLFPRARPGLVGRFYTHAIPRTRDPWLHNTEHYLLPARALGIAEPHATQMVVGTTDVDAADVRTFLQDSRAGREERPMIVLHPGTSQASKCWLPESYAAIAAALGDRFDIVITGSPGERGLAESIRADVPAAVPPPMIASGALTTLGQTAALISDARAVVTGDTSVLHVASALGVPFVGIYGSTRPRDNAPLYGPSMLLYDDDVPCAPCYQAVCPLRGAARLRCQKAITPERVLAALAPWLDESSKHADLALRIFQGEPMMARPKKLNEPEIAERTTLLAGWSRMGDEIRKTFAFPDFAAAMVFVNALASAAEQAQHHPDIDIRYNKVTVALTTHDAGGLTELDFALARTADTLA